MRKLCCLRVYLGNVGLLVFVVLAVILMTTKASLGNDLTSRATIQPAKAEIVFDITKTAHRFDGFGVQIVGNYRNPGELRRLLHELNIKYIRIENSKKGSSWDQMQKTRALTDQLGIKWIYMVWRGPHKLQDSKNNLKGELVGQFSDWWAAEVADLNSHGIRPEFIELMNEPDSNGDWSTGISPADYNKVAKLTREALDKAGFSDVGIVGPGTTHLNWDHHARNWINAMDSVAVDALAAWSTHCWDDGDICHGGSCCIEENWRDFSDAIAAKDPAGSKPIFITEYATKENKFFGVTYPHPEHNGGYNATNTVPYAVRVYENTLALANSGANVLVLWMARDQGWSKAWGLLDFSGTSKPVHYSLKTLFPKIPVGSYVLKPLKQDDVIYSGAFVKDNRLVIALVNDSSQAANAKLRIAGIRTIKIIEAIAFELDHRGDPSKENPDTGKTINKSLTANPDNRIDVQLPADSTLTIVCNFADE